MQSEKLPPKQDLAYVDCQYFNNGTGRGKTQHRLKFQYTTVHGDQDVFSVNLTDTKSKNLKAKCIRIAGNAKAESLMKEAKELQNEFSDVFLGFRREHVTRHHDGTLRKHPLYLEDQFSICWMVVTPDGSLAVHLKWNDESLVMPRMAATSQKTTGQSLFIAYYHAETNYHDQYLAKFGTSNSRGSGFQSANQGTTSLEHESSEPTSPGASTSPGLEPIRTERQREASYVGQLAEVQLDVERFYRPRIAVESAKAEDRRKLVDHERYGDWRVGSFCLGTSAT